MSARLRTGGQLRIIDASSYGALAETSERLLPGRNLDVHIVCVGGRVLVRARVARAYVSHVAADAIRFRAALAFERALDVRIEGYVMPSLVSGIDVGAGNSYPIQPLAGDIEFAEQLSA